MVSLDLETYSGEVVNISGLTYPAICSPISSKVDITEFSHLQGLQFADNTVHSANDNIDIFLCTDQYFDIVIGDIIRGEQDPVAIKTKLGLVLSGSTGNPGERVMWLARIYASIVMYLVLLTVMIIQIL